MTTLAQQLSPPPWYIHAAGSEAWPHVLTTWLRSYSSSPFAASIPSGVFHRWHHAIAERLLARGSLYVVSPTDCEVQYCAWALTEPGVLHYAYTKPEYRRMGFAKLLLAGLPADARYTHRTKDGARLVRPLWVYNPYLAME